MRLHYDGNNIIFNQEERRMIGTDMTAFKSERMVSIYLVIVFRRCLSNLRTNSNRIENGGVFVASPPRYLGVRIEASDHYKSIELLYSNLYRNPFIFIFIAKIL
uniref:AlNc14C133G7017 protein n=1 Tax=Albugo laibachii Nc14 TaxID=890382 RepID=F0WKG6_9STRA|nr:AlNc14C133G7017 [Albugo laibachii Nc14]|eukprot:CCA21770.1 AlNc14C133G7017 [Albugo laibachii Nc14]